MSEPCENTDRELFREGDYYAPSCHVTKDGALGINVGGTVIVKPLREWHKLAIAAQRTEQEPVAWMHTNEYGGERMLSFSARKGEHHSSAPLYAAPSPLRAGRAQMTERERFEAAWTEYALKKLLPDPWIEVGWKLWQAALAQRIEKAVREALERAEDAIDSLHPKCSTEECAAVVRAMLKEYK